MSPALWFVVIPVVGFIAYLLVFYFFYANLPDDEDFLE